jgi:phasin family protein
MITNFEDIQKYGKDNMDVAMKSFGAVSKTFQAIAVEVTDYSKKSFEDGTAALEKLMGAKTIEKAIEVQTDFVKSAYEGFVSEATKLGDMYTDLAKETYKPLEGLMAKAKAAA